jgi:S-adenosylmethionine:tRNA ribosyltransferase-isomerase
MRWDIRWQRLAMKRSALRFHLPDRLIAQRLSPNPSRTKLLILGRGTKTIAHKRFGDIVDAFKKNDLLVLNDSAVIPTRLWGVIDTAGQVEVTLVSKIRKYAWEAVIRPRQGVQKGARIWFPKLAISATLAQKSRFGGWCVVFTPIKGGFEAALKSKAEVNAPFYLKRNIALKEYQNLYAKNPGSTQCPTAGLHFTRRILNGLQSEGIKIAFVTLHVGGSVLPVSGNDFSSLRIYREYFNVPSSTIQAIMTTRSLGGRVIAVGTTVARALESVSSRRGQLRPRQGWTNLTIKEGHRFKVIDGFLTNFHLPGSTHLLLTTAFGGDGVRYAYREAIRLAYGFLDFGDAMLII